MDAVDHCEIGVGAASGAAARVSLVRRYMAALSPSRGKRAKVEAPLTLDLMAQAVHGEIRDDETKKCQCEHAGGMDLRGLRISRPAWRIVESARRAPHSA